MNTLYFVFFSSAMMMPMQNWVVPSTLSEACEAAQAHPVSVILKIENYGRADCFSDENQQWCQALWRGAEPIVCEKKETWVEKPARSIKAGGHGK